MVWPCRPLPNTIEGIAQRPGPRGRGQRLSASRLTFGQYLEFRLGPLGGRQAWFNFFIRPFGARSFAEFWRLWNPVYGYFLSYFVYRPLARALPRPIAVVATFLVCGFVLHDLPAWVFTRRILPPGATIAFLFFGVVLVISEALHMDLSQRQMPIRAAVNVAYLSCCVGAMLLVVSQVVRHG